MSAPKFKVGDRVIPVSGCVSAGVPIKITSVFMLPGNTYQYISDGPEYGQLCYHEHDLQPLPRFAVGDRVQKVKGYRFPGVVVSVFLTLSAQVRYVVECTVHEVEGCLHIYSERDLEVRA